MKTALYSTLLIIGMTVIFYVTGLITTADPNLVNWTEEGRFILAFLWMAGAFLFPVMIHQNQKEKKKE